MPLYIRIMKQSVLWLKSIVSTSRGLVVSSTCLRHGLTVERVFDVQYPLQIVVCRLRYVEQMEFERILQTRQTRLVFMKPKKRKLGFTATEASEQHALINRCHFLKLSPNDNFSKYVKFPFSAAPLQHFFCDCRV